MEAQLNYYQQKLAFEIDPSDLFHFMEASNEVIVIDTRQAHAFEKERIPNAINIHHTEINAASTKDLDTTKLVVCYCDGIGCNASTKGAIAMAQLGFQVKELTGGIEWWKKDGYATQGAESFDGLSVQCAC